MAKLDTNICPMHNVHVRKTKEGIRCPKFEECEWQIDKRGMPSGKFWDDFKDVLDKDGYYRNQVKIGDRFYVKPKKHMLSRCPIHGKKVAKSQKYDRETGEIKGYYYQCPQYFHEKCYGVTFVSKKPFGIAAEKLLEGTQLINDLPPPPGQDLFPDALRKKLELQIGQGKNSFPEEAVKKIASMLGVSEPQVLRRLYRMGFNLKSSKKESKMFKLSKINESMDNRGNNMTMEEFRRKFPIPYAELPHHNGKIHSYDNHFRFYPKKGPPLFWGVVDKEKRPIFNDDGEIAAIRWTKDQEAGWYTFNYFSREQKKYLEHAFGRLQKSEKQGSYASNVVYENPPSAKKKKRSSTTIPGEGPPIESPTPRTPGAASGMARSALRNAERAKSRKEPNWKKLPPEELQRALTVFINKAKSDARYQPVVGRILDALESSGKEISGARIGPPPSAPRGVKRAPVFDERYKAFLKKHTDALDDFREIRALVPRIESNFGYKKSVSDIRDDLEKVLLGKDPMAESRFIRIKKKDFIKLLKSTIK